MIKEGLDLLLNNFPKKKILIKAIERSNNAQSLLNAAMDSISTFEGVSILPFNQFQPSKASYWKDSCHLNAEGIIEKATFIGNYLINEIKLPSLNE